MFDDPVLAISLLASLPLNYLALSIADRIRPIDISWRRRLLLVALSAVLTVPLAQVSLWFVPLILGIDLLLLRWVYCETWKPTAIRLVIWYVLGMAFGLIFGILLGVVLAIAAPQLLPA